MSSKRKKNLEVAKSYFQFLQDSEEEERWVVEKIGVVRHTDIGKDLNAACVLMKRHEVCMKVRCVRHDLYPQGVLVKP